jgi:hypothetical protein
MIACASESSPWTYLEEGQYILENSQANIVKKFDIPSEENGLVEGFNLDGVVSEEGDDDTCGHGDFVNPYGEEGIDNQLGYLWSLIEPVVGAAETLLQGAINEGRFVMIIELENLDDYYNDENITLNIFPADIDPDIGTYGYISPDQTAHYSNTQIGTTIENVQLVDGVLEAGPFNFQLPIDILEAQFTMDLRYGFIRLEVQEDQTFSGVLSGAASVTEVLEELHKTDASDEVAYVDPLFRINADMGKEDGECDLLSMAYTFESTTIYVVRYEE